MPSCAFDLSRSVGGRRPSPAPGPVDHGPAPSGSPVSCTARPRPPRGVGCLQRAHASALDRCGPVRLERGRVAGGRVAISDREEFEPELVNARLLRDPEPARRSPIRAPSGMESAIAALTSRRLCVRCLRRTPGLPRRCGGCAPNRGRCGGGAIAQFLAEGAVAVDPRRRVLLTRTREPPKASEGRHAPATAIP
jgi:hypothetical protein